MSNKGGLSYAEFSEVAADTRTAMTALSKSALDLGLDKTISELVKTRVSQINGCAFCVAFHLKQLRGLNVDQARLDMLAVWRESTAFSVAERAALAWAEETARMTDRLPREDIRENLTAHFSREQIIGLNVTIASINAWNRMAVAFGFSPADIG
jgi:AhpD family alkylhydroperoxidase